MPAVLRYQQAATSSTFTVKAAVYVDDATARQQAAIDHQVLGRRPKDIINGTDPDVASPTFTTTAAQMTTFLNSLSVQKAKQWTSGGVI